ncbi:MAG TPA: metallophosphoesterase [Candidatus Hydrogenedentes bacterium]|nr:metallophosphoesterase [Candidatus Hydrogenedentota bacterium]HQH51872.1 metallophosphoesterase [Candidatus Hydrogenedentota bacterium]
MLKLSMRGLAIFILILSGIVPAEAVSGSPEGFETDVQTPNKPWTNLEFKNDPGAFQFAVVGDNAGGPRWGVFAEAVEKLNLLQPEFVIGVGDYIEGYEDTRAELDRQWEQFMESLAGLEAPFFFVPGNHDVGRPLWRETYTARFGAEYYHFVYRDVLFLCLCTNDGPDQSTGIGKQQVEYAARVLRDHPNVRWTLVFQHKPLWRDSDDTGWSEIAQLLKGRNCTVFSGHTHDYISHEEDGLSFVTLSTTGAGNPLRGPAYGELDQTAWVTMTSDGPRIANLTLDGILDRNFRTQERANELAAFSEGQVVTAAPVVLNADMLTSAESRLTIANPSETPLRLKVLFEPAAGVQVKPAAVATVIPGGQPYEVPLHISADAPIPMSEAQPLLVHWQANYDNAANQPSLQLEGQSVITFDSPFTVPFRGTPIAIDGKLDDWPSLPYKMNQPAHVYVNAPAWKGPHDCHFQFAVNYDAQYLYVAIKAFDDELCFDGWKYWEDFVMLWVDARGSGADDPKTCVFSAIAGPDTGAEQKAEFEEGEAPQGLLSASVATADGFEAEFAVPVSYLNERQQGQWRQVRLNVSVSDFDRHDARDGATVLSWRPQWFRPGDHPQSGLFIREAEAK